MIDVIGGPVSVGTTTFWRAYWTTLRPYLFFVSGVSGLVGLALPGQLDWPRFVATLAACFFSYGLGQALTDVTQIDTDSISSPYRPLTQGIVTPRQVSLVSLTGLVLCALVLGMSNPVALLPCGVAVAGLASYTPMKRRWWAGPLWNSWIVALLPLIGFLCAPATVSRVAGSSALFAAMGSVFFSYAIFVLLGYHKDISADRLTGYQTIPVRFGWSTSVLVSGGFLVAALICSALLMRAWTPTLATAADLLPPLFWAAGAAMLVAAHLAMLRTRVEAEAHGSIALVVRGYVLLHLGEATALMPLLTWPGLAGYALFELALAARPERSQI